MQVVAFDAVEQRAFATESQGLCGNELGQFPESRLFIADLRNSVITETAFRSRKTLQFIFDGASRSLFAVVTKNFVSDRAELISIDFTTGLTRSMVTLPVDRMDVAAFDSVGQRLYLVTFGISNQDTSIFELDLRSLKIRDTGFRTNFRISDWAFSPSFVPIPTLTRVAGIILIFVLCVIGLAAVKV
jgi:hypothetical protein